MRIKKANTKKERRISQPLVPTADFGGSSFSGKQAPGRSGAFPGIFEALWSLSHEILQTVKVSPRTRFPTAERGFHPSGPLGGPEVDIL